MTMNRRLITVVGRSVGLNKHCVGGTLSSNFDRIHYVAFSHYPRQVLYNSPMYCFYNIFHYNFYIFVLKTNYFYVQKRTRISPNV